MRQGEDASTRRLLVVRHVLPEHLRIVGIYRREGQDPVRILLVVAENNDTVQVVSVRMRTEFVPDHRGEDAGLVVFFGKRGRLVPGVSQHPGVTDPPAVRIRLDDGLKGLEAVTTLDQIV